jgi:CO/xanthine dehydrogenase FAD-binding subunit
VNCYRAKDLDDALMLVESHPDYMVLCGSTDAAVVLKKKSVSGIIDIHGLSELRYIETVSDEMRIGALTSIADILESDEVKAGLPLLVAASEVFASRQIRNLATIGGNIANASPAADLTAVLLVLNATVTLGSSKGRRVVDLEDLFCGYKCTKLDHEIILDITIPLKKHGWYYRKTGARERLNITKVSIVVLKGEDGYRVSGASLNPYASRFRHVEKLLDGGDVSDEKIMKALEYDIAPSGSFRSTEAYRRRVASNMIKEAFLGMKDL